MKKIIEKIGDECRHCNTPVVLKESLFKIQKLVKNYFYFATLTCPNCKAFYMQERFKIINGNPISKEEIKLLISEMKFVVNKLPKKTEIRKKKFKPGKRLQPAMYESYINSKVWEKKRQEILILTPFCYCCSIKANHVHHKIYKRLGVEKLEDLVALCSGCHMAIHDLIKNDKSVKLINAHEIYRQLIQVRV